MVHSLLSEKLEEKDVKALNANPKGWNGYILITLIFVTKDYDTQKILLLYD